MGKFRLSYCEIFLKNDPGLKLKAKDRWYVPDPNKQADLEKLREKSLLREFETYRDGLVGNRKKTQTIPHGSNPSWIQEGLGRKKIIKQS